VDQLRPGPGYCRGAASPSGTGTSSSRPDGVMASGAPSWVPGSSRTPAGEDWLTTVTYSLEPSGQMTWNVLPGGRVENGAPLWARYTAASCAAPPMRASGDDSTVVTVTCDSSPCSAPTRAWIITAAAVTE